MEALKNQVAQLSEQNRLLTAERDRLKKLASLYQTEAFEEKLKTLTTSEHHATTREEQRSRDRDEWERERLKERSELELMWAKERGETEKARAKEREESQLLNMQVEELEKKIATVRAEGMQILAEEREIWEKARINDRDNWEKQVRETNKECQKKIGDEETRWREHLATQKETLEREREQERADWKSRLEGLEERCQRLVLELQISHRRSPQPILENYHTSSERNTMRDTLVTSLLTPHHSESLSPAPAVPDTKREIDTPMPSQPHKLRKASPEIIDLSCDSPPRDVKLEMDLLPFGEPISAPEEAPIPTPESRPTSPSQDVDMQDAVGVPTVAPSRGSPASSIRPPVKKSTKIDGIALSHSRRTEYLIGTSLFTITPDYFPVSISRCILNRLYGAKTVGLEWISSDEQHHIMTPSYNWNPDMPRAPGEPGLLLITYDSVVKNSPWTLFYKLDTGKNVRWGYAGEYECKEVGKFMKEDFAALSDEVKNTWGNNVCERKGAGAMLDMRARMTLRKLHKREPTRFEVQAETTNIKRGKTSYDLTPHDVIDSFVRGEEHIKVMSMQCVDYVHSRAKELMEEQKIFEKEEERKKLAKDFGKLMKTFGVQPRKRARDSPEVSRETTNVVTGDGADSTATPLKRRKTVADSQHNADASTSASSRSPRVEPQAGKSKAGSEGADRLECEDDPNDTDFYCDD